MENIQEGLNMKYRKQSLLLISILIISNFMLAKQAMAGDTVSNFRCNNKFVTLGDSKAVVFIRCGEPLFRETVSGNNRDKVEEWTYRPKGNRSFLRILTFTRGKLTRIERGEAVSR